MRKLKIFFITLACLLVSNVAFTLGVGHIKVNSALSEPLDAEIQLFSVRPGEGENIRVTLATLKEFTAAGIDRTLNLSSLKFKVVEKGDGNAYIKVFSDRPIREPFLDFLVDIDWPSGRLLREYTILLDPPIFAQRKAAPVQTPKVAAPTRIVREPAPAPTVTRTAPVPSAPVVNQRDDLFPRIEIDNTAAPAIDRSPRVAAPAYSGDTYKVQKSQTLWSIADAVRPDSSIGVSQMMLALQKENPEAFTGNNINGLKSGVILRIPDIAAIQAIDRQDAVELAKQQNLQWRAAQDNLTTSEVASGATTTSSLPAGTPGQPPVKTESTVKLVTPDTGAAGTQQGVGEDDSAAAEKLALINEQLASKSKENDKLQERVKSLEDQIGSMERLLELKDDSLSELQSKLGDAKPAPTPEATPVPAPEPKVEEVKPEPAKPVQKQVVPDDSKINPYALDEIPKVKPTPKPAPKPAAQPAPSEPGLFDDPAILAAMIGVVVAVLALIWLVLQRRRNTMQFPESILSSKPAPSTTTATASGANAETSLLSDFAPSAMDGALETDSSEVDPSAEADVYIAYGKHQQAEELLRAAIEEEPARLDLRLKLMEVYHAKGDADAFLAEATELNNNMDDQNTALWDKAVVMGKELCPGNELFGEADAVGEDDFSDLEGIGELDDDLDLSLDMDDVASATDADELSIDTEDELSLDMELESFDTGSELEETPDKETETDTDSELSLDIEDLSLDDDLQTSDIEKTEEPEIEIDDLALEIEETPTDDNVEADLSDMDVDSLLDDEPQVGEDDDALLGMDEVATKLDLAKAYIDMGDPDGARAILDEVLTEGNDAQQSEAKGLIDQL